MAQRLDELVAINSNDMLDSFGLGGVRQGRRLLEAACYWPARRFARTVLEFDRRVLVAGLHEAAAWGMRELAADVQVIGAGHLPPDGPVLVVANHPGITDTLAIFAALPRPDLHTVAAVRPFLSVLDNMTRRLIFVDESAPAHLGVVRSVARHLRAGGCVLTFPAGRIEPDPAVLPGAGASFEQWTDSIGLFARLVPEAQIVPLLVSGVFSPAALGSPLARLRREQKDRERFAAMLQVAFPHRYPVRVRVALGPPLAAGDLLASGAAGGVKQAVVVAMGELLAAAPRAPAAHKS
jgi:1-acyl-sn-glycerol-3-phosphate acyltransferase